MVLTEPNVPARKIHGDLMPAGGPVCVPSLHHAAATPPGVRCPGQALWRSAGCYCPGGTQPQCGHCPWDLSKRTQYIVYICTATGSRSGNFSHIYTRASEVADGIAGAS